MARIKLPINWLRVFYHVLFWAVYIPLNAAIACVIQGIDIYENIWTGMIGEAFLVPPKMLLVYYIFYYVIPLYIDRIKVFKLILLIVIGFVISVIFYRLIDSKIYLAIFQPDNRVPVFSQINLMLAAFDTFITATAALSIKMIRVQYRSQEYEQELIKEKLRSELSFLRAQTNPHFLFNTLNNLYGLSRKKSDKTPEAIMMLSKILRFMLYDCRAHQIPIASEAKIIKDYIELEKLRYNDRLLVTYEEQIENPGALIAPLLLLPFIENSFKHGAHSSVDQAQINIKINLQGNHLKYEVDNTFDPTNTPPKDENASGIGVRNVRRQLDLIYPNQHELEISDDGTWFRSRLEIDLY